MDVQAVAPAPARAPHPTVALPAHAAADTNNPEPGALTTAISRLLGQAHGPQPTSLNVSYRVEHREIVTVFSDPKTGKEVAQFPPELLIQMAVFFDKHNGVTLDRNA